MPELPEVEAIRTQLDRFFVGHKILSLDVKNRRTFPNDEKLIIGSKVVGVRRFGKVTVIDLNNGYSILAHVKLTGQFIYRGPNLKENDLSKKVIGGIPGPHTLVIFTLDRNGILYYNDVRRFGWIKIEKTEKLNETNEFIKNLGPEPLKDLTLKDFEKIVLSTSRNIKVLLMDQKKIAGVGNIYANDALWKAGINPKRQSKTLSKEETERLFKSIESVLKMGLKYGGASELAFVTPDGREGEYQNHSLVYGREGKPCLKCKTKIDKYFLGGRGTYVCSSCQK